MYHHAWHILQVFKFCYYYYFILCVLNVLPACMSTYHECVWYSRRPEEGISFPELEVQVVVTTWVLGIEPSLLERQLVLLSTKLSLKLLLYGFNYRGRQSTYFVMFISEHFILFYMEMYN